MLVIDQVHSRDFEAVLDSVHTLLVTWRSLLFANPDTMKGLPVELYHNIVDLIDNEGDLIPLLHACTAMRFEAQRRLYRVITADSVKEIDTPSAKILS